MTTTTTLTHPTHPTVRILSLTPYACVVHFAGEPTCSIAAPAESIIAALVHFDGYAIA